MQSSEYTFSTQFVAATVVVAGGPRRYYRPRPVHAARSYMVFGEAMVPSVHCLKFSFLPSDITEGPELSVTRMQLLAEVAPSDHYGLRTPVHRRLTAGNSYHRFGECSTADCRSRHLPCGKSVDVVAATILRYGAGGHPEGAMTRNRIVCDQ